MSQINLHVTREFELHLKRVMKERGFATKSEAIRAAVKELAEKSSEQWPFDPARWQGALKGLPIQPGVRGKSSHDLLRELDDEQERTLK